MRIFDGLVQRLPGSVMLKPGHAFGLGNIAAANLPTCNASRQNEMRYIPGAAGVADRWVTCEKDAADAYAWQDKGDAALDAAYSASAHTHSYVPIGTDPNADRLYFWDDSGSAPGFLTAGAGLTISGTTMVADPTLDELDGVVITAAADGEVIQYNGTNWVDARPAPFLVPFLIIPSLNTGTTIWTNMPAAQTELQGTDQMRKRVDLTNVRQVRLHVEVAVVGHTTAILDVQYATNIGTPAFTDLNLDIPINALGWQGGTWTTLPVGARTDVLLRVVGEGGNAAVDPIFRNVCAEFR